MTPHQREFVLSRICGESIHLVTEKVDPDRHVPRLDGQ
jgi:hypothetical protein